jgi:hypothetical protein
MSDDNYICPICSKEFDKFFNRYQANNGQVACSMDCYGILKQRLSDFDKEVGA